MAIGTPFGLKPVRTFNGDDWHSAVQYLPVRGNRGSGTITTSAVTGSAVAYPAGALGIGSVVGLDSSGYAAPLEGAAVGAGTAAVPYGVVVGFGTGLEWLGDLGGIAAGAEVAGAGVVGTLLDPSNLMRKYLAYNEAGYVAVVPCATTLFEIAVKTGSVAATANMLRPLVTNVQIGDVISYGTIADTPGTGINAVNPVTGWSTVEASITTTATNAVNTALVVVGYDTAPDVYSNITTSGITAGYAGLLVKFHPTHLSYFGI